MAIAFQHLTRNDKGVTTIAGRRIRVHDVLGYTHEGNTPTYIAENYDLPLAAVYEALAYAEEHPDEMATLRVREDAAYEEIMAQSPPELRAEIDTIKRAAQSNGSSVL